MPHDLAILIPVYKPGLNLLEQFSIDYLLTKVSSRELVFVAPIDLDIGYYRSRYPSIQFERFPAHYFDSIAGYNELLLSSFFYERFVRYDYILIHQTDALLFQDDLDAWMDLGYDYIGAPWPHGMLLGLAGEAAEVYGGSQFHAFVGNGGFSLRCVPRTISILDKAQTLHAFWRANLLNEDCFFAFAGLLTQDFKIPPVDVASRFSLEMQPAQYVNANAGQLPTGCHAWWKYDLPFWQSAIATVG